MLGQPAGDNGVEPLAHASVLTAGARTRYNAVAKGYLPTLMGHAGVTSLEHCDGRFDQPVSVGNRAALSARTRSDVWPLN